MHCRLNPYISIRILFENQFTVTFKDNISLQSLCILLMIRFYKVSIWLINSRWKAILLVIALTLLPTDLEDHCFLSMNLSTIFRNTSLFHVHLLLNLPQHIGQGQSGTETRLFLQAHRLLIFL